MTRMITPNHTSRVISCSHGRIVINFTTLQSGTVILKRMDIAEAQQKLYAVTIQRYSARNDQTVYAAESPPLVWGMYAIICPSTASIVKTIMVFAGTTAEVTLNGEGLDWHGSTGQQSKSDRQRRRVRRYYTCRDTNADHSTSEAESFVKV